MNRDHALLLTIRDYIERAESHVEWYDLWGFCNDLKTYDASCMMLQQIWECASKLSEWINLANIPVEYMRWLRNRISHDYMWLDDEKIWDTIKVSIPELRKIIEGLLKSF